MASYLELQAQIQELQKQAAEQRKHELANAVGNIKSIMAEYGITPDDLGFRTATGFAKQRRTSTTTEAKYRDPESNMSWSGRGRRPEWIAKALEAGKTLEDFLIK